MPRVYDADLAAPTYLYERGNEKLPRKDKPIGPSVVGWIPAAFEVFPVDLPRESYAPELAEVVKNNALQTKRKQEQNAREELTKIQSASAGVENVADGLSPLRLAEQKLQLATADLQSLEARYAADEAKYSQSSELSKLARVAAVAEHRRVRLELDVQLLEKRIALKKAESSDQADAAKRQAAIDAAKQSLMEAEKKRSEHADLAEDATTYPPVVNELPRQSSGRRTALARWIVDPQNPLTARVAINHIWLRHFGTPLVESVFDFGMKTPAPELLDLLNWLSAELIASDWDMKHIHRLILASEVYASATDERDQVQLKSNLAVDPDNRLYWRANVRRLDAEEVRDHLLAAADCMDRKFSGEDIDFEQGEQVYRRSLYFRHAYEKQMSLLVLFDAANPGDCYRRRPSVIPQQALALANSTLTHSAAKILAKELHEAVGDDSARFVVELFARTLGRSPSEDEQRLCLEFLRSQQATLTDTSTLKPLVSAAKAAIEPATDPAQRSRESLTLVMLNHNDFVTLR